MRRFLNSGKKHQITNAKTQLNHKSTSTKKQLNYKLQIPNINVFENCNLIIGAYLRFGFCHLKFYPRCLKTSNNKIPVETETFNESVFPNMGIFARYSVAFKLLGCMPLSSEPIMIAVGPVRSIS